MGVRPQVLSSTLGSSGFTSGLSDQCNSEAGTPCEGALIPPRQTDHARRPARPFRTVAEIAQSSFGIEPSLIVLGTARKREAGLLRFWSAATCRRRSMRSAAFTPLHRSRFQGPGKNPEPHVICTVKRRKRRAPRE